MNWKEDDLGFIVVGMMKDIMKDKLLRVGKE